MISQLIEKSRTLRDLYVVRMQILIGSKVQLLIISIRIHYSMSYIPNSNNQYRYILLSRIIYIYYSND